MTTARCKCLYALEKFAGAQISVVGYRDSMVDASAIPQANRLRVVREFVKMAETSDPANFGDALNLSERHVLYYMAAARSLGWITGDLPPRVTPEGRALLATEQGSAAEAEVMERSFRGSEALQAVAPDLFEFDPPSETSLADRIRKKTGLAESTAMRRARTLLAWRDQIMAARSSLFRGSTTFTPSSTTAAPPIRISPEGTASSTVSVTPRIQFRHLISLRLENFKNFADAKLPLGPLTMIAGTNASGKSNLRDAFRFLHGLSRGYTLAEILGEKWIEGGVLQWKGIRGGTREAAFRGGSHFALEAKFEVSDKGKSRVATYLIDVDVGESGKPPRVRKERLVIEGRGQFVFDSHPESNPPPQSDEYHLSVRLRKEEQKGWVGPVLKVYSNTPALTQLAEHPDVKPASVRDHIRLAISAFQSMRFLDLSPDEMRKPSVPGQDILSDRGENLSSVLEAICRDESRKRALLHWVSALTPVDARDFKFPADATGKILLTLVEEGGHETSAYSASDGTLRFLAMIAALLGPAPARFYFLEELENGIHPTRLHLLLNLIERQTGLGLFQLVATTHSPQLLSSLSPSAQKDAVLVYRSQGESRATIQPIHSIPEAERVLNAQDLGNLLSSGWLEDAVYFAEGEDQQ